MARYLIRATYTAEGARGLIKEGGSSRKSTLGQAAHKEDQAETFEAFYFAFGEDDVYVIADLPDNVTAAAVGLTVSRLGFGTDPHRGASHSRGDRRGHEELAGVPRAGGVRQVSRTGGAAGAGCRMPRPSSRRMQVTAPLVSVSDAGGWTASRTSSPLWPGTPPAAADPPMRRRVGACLSMRMRWQRVSAPQGSNAHTSSASAGWAGSLSPEETAIEVPALLLPAFCSM